MNRLLFQGSFSISPDVAKTRLSSKTGKAHFSLAEKLLKEVEPEIRALPSSVKLRYTSKPWSDSSGDGKTYAEDRVEIRFKTHYNEDYQDHSSGWICIKDEIPKTVEDRFRPENGIPALIKAAIAKAKEDAAFFKVKDDFLP